jgi:hypothetical protein
MQRGAVGGDTVAMGCRFTWGAAKNWISWMFFMGPAKIKKNSWDFHEISLDFMGFHGIQ